MAAIGFTTAGAAARPADRSADGNDWVTQSADTIEKFVVTVRSKTTEPVEWVTRVLVYGILAAIVGTAALILLAILAIRMVDIALPGEVWSAYALLGGISTVLGLFIFSKRNVDKQK
jgi:hypothetical protein